MRRRITKRPRRPRTRAGFALLEVMLALTILAGAILTAGGYFTRMARGVSDEKVRAQALYLIGERFEEVKTSPTYGQIDDLYSGTESSLQGYPGYSRNTAVLRIGGTPSDTVDYKVITVTVTTPAIPKSVRVTKSTIIADY